MTKIPSRAKTSIDSVDSSDMAPPSSPPTGVHTPISTSPGPSIPVALPTSASSSLNTITPIFLHNLRLLADKLQRSDSLCLKDVEITMSGLAAHDEITIGALLRKLGAEVLALGHPRLKETPREKDARFVVLPSRHVIYPLGLQSAKKINGNDLREMIKTRRRREVEDIKKAEHPADTARIATARELEDTTTSRSLRDRLGESAGTSDIGSSKSAPIPAPARKPLSERIGRF
jgi:hypothetical protein